MIEARDSSDKPQGSARRGLSPWQALASGLSTLTLALLAIAWWVWQPATLRIAVGPPGSDDQTLVLAIAKALEARASPVRLAPITTDGTLQSLNLLGDGKADLAVARGDLEMPADTTSVAILRKNVVVLWSGQRSARGEARPRITEIKELAAAASALPHLAMPTSPCCASSWRNPASIRKGFPSSSLAWTASPT